MKTSHLRKFLILILISTTISGCSNNTMNLSAFERPNEVDVTPKEYILQPADEITVSATRVPELHDKIQTIRPDGKVSFETVGDVYIAGKTPSEVAKLLSEKISRLYTLKEKNPIDVRVSRFQSKLYYVIGQVTFPGAKNFTGRETTLSALAKAVPTFQACKGKIQLVRPSTGSEVKARICQLNFNNMIIKGDMSYNVLLEEGDVLYVPPTILAAIGMTVGQLLNPILGGAGAARALMEPAP